MPFSGVYLFPELDQGFSAVLRWLIGSRQVKRVRKDISHWWQSFQNRPRATQKISPAKTQSAAAFLARIKFHKVVLDFTY
jgi:hypothetical protein